MLGPDSTARHARQNSNDPLSGLPPVLFLASVPQSSWMDEVTSRTRPTSRRMASAKSSGTSRRSSSGRGPTKKQESEVSPARWAGVALVIAAIVGAITLAMVSPSDAGPTTRPGTALAEVPVDEPSPSPSATALDVGVPVVAPAITTPKDGTVIGEFEIAVTVEVPEDRTVPRKHLDLHIYNGSQLVKTEPKPKLGETVTVQGVRLAPGINTLTAVLGSPAGPGPRSEPHQITLDEDKPVLQIVAPKNKYQTYDESVTVEVSSEVDASVTIHNEANEHDRQVTIGPSGDASQLIRLKWGKNRIVATSVNEAGLTERKVVNVTRLDGRPTVKLKVPESVRPPEQVRVVAEVSDAGKKPMRDAEVYLTLTAPNQSTLSQNGETNAKGRFVWEVQIEDSSSTAEALEVGVTVISPSGEQEVEDETIALR